MITAERNFLTRTEQLKLYEAAVLTTHLIEDPLSSLTFTLSPFFLCIVVFPSQSLVTDVVFS
jgi:hypothetical protein